MQSLVSLSIALQSYCIIPYHRFKRLEA